MENQMNFLKLGFVKCFGGHDRNWSVTDKTGLTCLSILGCACSVCILIHKCTYVYRTHTLLFIEMVLVVFLYLLVNTKAGWDILYDTDVSGQIWTSDPSHAPYLSIPLRIFYAIAALWYQCSLCVLPTIYINLKQRAYLGMQASSLHPCQCSSTPISIRAHSIPRFHHLFYVLAPAAPLA